MQSFRGSQAENIICYLDIGLISGTHRSTYEEDELWELLLMVVAYVSLAAFGSIVDVEHHSTGSSGPDRAESPRIDSCVDIVEETEMN